MYNKADRIILMHESQPIAEFTLCSEPKDLSANIFVDKAQLPTEFTTMKPMQAIKAFLTQRTGSTPLNLEDYFQQGTTANVDVQKYITGQLHSYKSATNLESWCDDFWVRINNDTTDWEKIQTQRFYNPKHKTVFFQHDKNIDAGVPVFDAPRSEPKYFIYGLSSMLQYSDGENIIGLYTASSSNNVAAFHILASKLLNAILLELAIQWEPCYINFGNTTLIGCYCQRPKQIIYRLNRDVTLSSELQKNNFGNQFTFGFTEMLNVMVSTLQEKYGINTEIFCKHLAISTLFDYIFETPVRNPLNSDLYLDSATRVFSLAPIYDFSGVWKDYAHDFESTLFPNTEIKPVHLFTHILEELKLFLGSEIMHSTLELAVKSLQENIAMQLYISQNKVNDIGAIGLNPQVLSKALQRIEEIKSLKLL